MLESKYMTKAVAVMTAAAVILCLASILFSENLAETFGGKIVAMEYESRIFDTSQIISIDILIAEEEWNEMLDNAMSEVYYSCDVVVNGTTFCNVGIRPKGNTSLSAIASDPENDRYSFKIEFDKFVEGQTCWGLDKLVLNNNYADATGRKEAIVYDMYQYLDVDASLYNYAKISVNGDYWGVYLALEAVEDSFLLRNYGVEDGNLYKPDSMNMDKGGKEGRKGFDVEGFPRPDDDGTGEWPGRDGKEEPPGRGKEDVPAEWGKEDVPEERGKEDVPAEWSGKQASPERGGFPRDSGDGMPGGFSGRGANLNYMDDDLDSYTDIWESSITKSSKADHKNVVSALKNISEGIQLEKYLDIDNILKYMAVHSFSVNEDSLSGMMAHNYYLYENNGQLNILPWDYNLSFGGMAMGGEKDGTSMVNDPIDTPFSGTEFFDALLENEEYLAKYHEYYEILVEEYLYGGKLEETYQRISNQIDDLVKTDPNSMYTYEEYEKGVQTLYDTIMLRAESIRGQLDGIIPSTQEGQRTDSGNLVDGSAIDISSMGVFTMGGGAP